MRVKRSPQNFEVAISVGSFYRLSCTISVFCEWMGSVALLAWQLNGVHVYRNILYRLYTVLVLVR